MASSKPMKDIEDNFLQCSICLNNFKEPKLLPCLHRFCKDCLTKIIEKEGKTTLDCPLCKYECVLPTDGASGFKTDFHIKSMCEFLELQSSLEEDKAKECIGCSNIQNVTAFCFRCRDFLCDQCYHNHLASRMFIEHQQHILHLENVEAKNLTLQKLASLTEEPRCQDHPKFIAQLCCVTCDNLPVCLTCTYNKHKDHDLQDVTEIAKAEIKKITATLDELDIYRGKVYELQKKIKNARQALKENVIKKTEKLTTQHRDQFEEMERKVKENDIELEKTKAEILETTQKECQQVKMDFDERIERLKQECKGIVEEKEKRCEEKTREAQENHDKKQADLFRKLGALNGDLKSFKEIIDTLSRQNEAAIQEIADPSDHTINRYENFTATTSAILASNDDWTDAQCLPDVRAASKPLTRDMKRDHPELTSLRDLIVRDLPPLFEVKVTLSKCEESAIYIKGVEAKGWGVKNITSIGDDRIVITGNASAEHSFIAVVNMKGEILREDKIQKVQGSRWPLYRHCDSLSKDQIVTLCHSGQIGIYDVRNGSHIKKNTSDVTSSWSSDRRVSCITTDSFNKMIYVGSMSSTSCGISRDVLVYDCELHYRRTLVLPEMIRGSNDITLHKGCLVVCDWLGRKAYRVNLDAKLKLAQELPKPDKDGGTWIPLRVCTDSNDFIYMVWGVKLSGQERRVITQYSQDGFQLLYTISVDDFPAGMCTLVADEEEKLLIATAESGKINTYTLQWLLCYSLCFKREEN